MNTIETKNAPTAVGPYSQAVKANGWLFCSGQLGMDPTSGELAGDVATQATLALTNLKAVIEAAGTTMGAVVKTTIFLADMADFTTVNTIYAAAFGDHRPARACVQAAALPKNALVEIEAIACCP